jgi:Tol biopolymer transport system component
MQGGGNKIVKTNRSGVLAAAGGALVAVGLLMVMLMVVEARPAGATFPGPNGKIAYAVLNSGIYTISPGGGSKSKVTDTLVSGDAKPSYSPGGKRIAYSDYDGQDYEIYTINVGGGGKIQVTNNNTHDFYPAYSPDDKKIAYTEYSDVAVAIYTINADGGGGKYKVTGGSNPAYSPDGRKIAYESLDPVGGDYEIHTINVTGGSAFKVTDNETDDFDPDYSPDGKRIAYASYEGPDTEIYTINVGGGTPFQVTNNVKDEEAPSYSPDGKKIAYECYKALGSDDDEDFDHEICTINVGGGGKTKVTDAVGYASDPSWGRRP